MSEGAHQCPTCDRADFKSMQGVRLHHKKTHGESIAGVEVTCEHCNEPFRVKPVREDEAKYCSRGCTSASWEGEDSPLWVARRSKACGACGGSFTPKPSRFEEATYCSRACANGAAQIPTDCSNCGDEFTAPPSRVTRSENLYCCPECQWEAREQRVEYDCEYCGATVEKTPSREKYDNHHFCNQECANRYFTGENHHFWKGGVAEHIDYGPNWTQQRRLARERDGFKCQGCGIQESDYHQELDVHHLTPFKTFDDPEQANELGNLTTLCRSCHREWERLSPLRPDTVAPSD